MSEQRELTFGEKACGVDFNPSSDMMVHNLKSKYAEIVDILNDIRKHNGHMPEVQRMASIAITETQTAQMWAVKTVTWRHL